MASDPTSVTPSAEEWPDLPLEAWQDTYDTLHLWTQIVGKIRLAKAPMLNHWWQVPLYVTCRGLSTSPIPQAVLQFLESSYAAAADLGHWDRAVLER